MNKNLNSKERFYFYWSILGFCLISFGVYLNSYANFKWGSVFVSIKATLFAIYLLAPKKSFTEKLKNKNFNSETINELSDYFQISTYAACLHYIDLTDLACSLIINNRNGTIIYERRSKQFINGFYHQFLYKQKIPSGTHTYDFVNGISSDKSEEIELNSWYPDLKNKITATENILELCYNNFVLTLIEPHKSSDEENY